MECKVRARAAGQDVDALSEEDFQELARRVIANSGCARFTNEVLVILKLDRQSGTAEKTAAQLHMESMPTSTTQRNSSAISRSPIENWVVQEVSAGTFRGSGRMFFDTVNFPGVRLREKIK